MSHKPHPHPNLVIRLFGAPQIQLDGVTITGLPAKTQALLFYLAVTGQPHLRAKLASLLWGEMLEKNARGNLRKAIRQLQAILPNHLSLEQQSVSLDESVHLSVDVITFEQQIDQSEAAHDIQPIEEAVALYRGDFLAGFLVRQAPDFEAWQAAQHTRLREMMLDGLQALSRDQQARNELEPAIATTRRLLDIEPWREEAHRQLMELLAQTGQRTAALSQYDLCRQALWDEMAVEPSAETEALYQYLKTEPAPALKPPQPRLVTTTDYPLVGREAAWIVLQTQWQNLTRPHFVCISGEAGIGKTRLAEELMMATEREGHHVVHARSHALAGRLAYGPVADWLRTEPLKSRLQTLDQLWLTELTRLLPELLIERPHLPKPDPLEERWQRKRLFEALAHAFTDSQGPLLLVLDDLQWCDNDTLEWLQYLVESGTTPLLVVGTVRAEEIEADHPLPYIRAQLHRLDQFTDIALSYLTAAATQSLATQVADDPLDDDLADNIFADTAGNPLFIIERVRANTNQATLNKITTPETSANATPDQLIPPKMYSVIQSRLQRLSPEATMVVEIGATFGRAFEIDLLSHALEASLDQILTALDELWHQRIIREVDSTRFDFSHDRIRDVAYAEISPIRRRLLHQQLVNALEVIHRQNLEAIAGQLAFHCQAAGFLEKAVEWYQQAANLARQLLAHQESVDYLQKALGILNQLTDHSENIARRIDLLFDLAKSQSDIMGVGHKSVGAIRRQIYALAMETGTHSQQLLALRGLALYYRNAGQWYQSQKYATELMALGKDTDDIILNMERIHAVALVNLHLGKPQQALTYYKQLREKSARSLPRWSSILTFKSAHCLWLLGFPDQARVLAHQSVEVLSKTSPLSVLQATVHRLIVFVFCRDIKTVGSLVTNHNHLAAKWVNPNQLYHGNIIQAWVSAHTDNAQIDLAQIYENPLLSDQSSSRMFEPIWRSLLVEILLLAGEVAKATAEIEATLKLAIASGNCLWNVHLLKLKGDCVQAQSGSTAQAAALYQQAIDVAKKQAARSLELRATVSLARLWQKQGKTAEAYQQLSKIYSWFTEGFDTADLLEAKALLQELQVG